MLPIGMWDGTATHKHRELCVAFILQQEPYFLPLDQRVRPWKGKVRVSPETRANRDISTTIIYSFVGTPG
jgi:hypothetical protein